MEKFIPYEKLSKKKQRELDLKKRGSWGGLNPVTRTTPNPRAYNRRKAQKWDDGSRSAPFVFPSMPKKSEPEAVSDSLFLFFMRSASFCSCPQQDR